MKKTEKTLPAIISMAFEARKRAEASQALRKSVVKRIARPATIEQEISSIHRIISSVITDDLVAVVERPKNAVSKGIISIYNRHDLERETQEASIYKELSRQVVDRSALAKPRKAVPKRVYVIYPNIYEPSKIGSVAIYGNDAPEQFELIDRHRVLFGHKVKSVTLEQGLHIFVSVRLGA